MEGKYITFNLVEKKAKTKVYAIINKKHGGILGLIKWNSGWRQYCFFPQFDTVWSAGCLNDVINFIAELKKERE